MRWAGRSGEQAPWASRPTWAHHCRCRSHRTARAAPPCVARHAHPPCHPCLLPPRRCPRLEQRWSQGEPQAHQTFRCSLHRPLQGRRLQACPRRRACLRLTALRAIRAVPSAAAAAIQQSRVSRAQTSWSRRVLSRVWLPAYSRPWHERRNGWQLPLKARQRRPRSHAARDARAPSALVPWLPWRHTTKLRPAAKMQCRGGRCGLVDAQLPLHWRQLADLQTAPPRMLGVEPVRR